MGPTPLRINGEMVCVNCEKPTGPAYFLGRRVRPPCICRDCRPMHSLWMKWLSGRSTAAACVARAIKHGHLVRPVNFACVDCDRPAQCYDHRDYGRPLDVVPVCRSCNVRRRTAKPLNPILVSALLYARLSEAILPSP